MAGCTAGTTGEITSRPSGGRLSATGWPHRIATSRGYRSTTRCPELRVTAEPKLVPDPIGPDLIGSVERVGTDV